MKTHVAYCDSHLEDSSNKDIVESNKYSYETFISKVDRWLDEI